MQTGRNRLGLGLQPERRIAAAFAVFVAHLIRSSFSLSLNARSRVGLFFITQNLSCIENK
jgi:hypothetical protein